MRESLRTIFRWKLQAFLVRFAKLQTFPNGISDAEIAHAIAPSRSIILAEDQTISHALRALDALPGVGVPVASAILMAMYPDALTVIDRQAYKTLNAPFRDPIPPSEYIAYVAFCRSQARALGVTLREYDRALWQAGSEASR